MKALLSRIHAKLGDLWWYTILLFVAVKRVSLRLRCFADIVGKF